MEVIEMVMEFVDRVPTYANRVKVTPESGAEYYATIVRADSPITNGTPLNAETFNQLQTLLESLIATAQSAANTAQNTANSAQTTANAAMPKSGGTFTGNVVACSTNRVGGCIRNITVTNAAGTSNVSTNYILMVRK